MLQPHCCGTIIFDSTLSKTILVQTPQGWFGFPKGKRHKGETDMECALRETFEETGLSREDLILTENYVDETSPKGSISVRYFVAKIKNDNATFKFDCEELASVEWISISEIQKIEKIKPQRKELVNKALHVL